MIKAKIKYRRWNWKGFKADKYGIAKTSLCHCGLQRVTGKRLDKKKIYLLKVHFTEPTWWDAIIQTLYGEWRSWNGNRWNGWNRGISGTLSNNNLTFKTFYLQVVEVKK